MAPNAEWGRIAPFGVVAGRVAAKDQPMTLPDQHTVVFHSRHRGQCKRRALVLQAMDIDHGIRFHAGTWVLMVPGSRAAEAVDQLDSYVRENQDWPKRRTVLRSHRVGARGVAGYAVVLMLVAAAKEGAVFDKDWFGAGLMQAGMVRDGEWWRTLTALTLHLNGEHLLSNLLFGAAFGLMTGHLLGNGLAWFSILVAGAAGNALNAMVQPYGHTAVGASTAVFAALGLSAAFVWRRRRDASQHWAIRWAPVVGAIVLLAYTGSGGERTDVVAHLTGFLAGIGMGAYYGGLGPAVASRARTQRLLGAAAVVLVALAWAIAIGAHGGVHG